MSYRSNQPRGNNNNSNNNNGRNITPPSPWLKGDKELKPSNAASFIEYLRHLREPEKEYKDVTKIQILQIAQENAKYSDRLKQLNQRTKLIAGEDNSFKVKCPWRIRVGGHRGPENILLPAFDALGMPYIPSSTLRGVARSQAIREIVASKNVKWQEAEKQVAPYFGSIDIKNGEDCAGKVVFLDAYPLPSDSGGLSMDMANNIWKWEGSQLQYQSNPNVFLSLYNSEFLVGLRLVSNCQDQEVLDKVKQWLILGLEAGIGSQINSGYGRIITPDKSKSSDIFFKVKFALEGQLIHGHQKLINPQQPFKKNSDGSFKLNRNGELQANTSSVPEVRAIAFKSMLRYWFRAFAFGVLPAAEVINWESLIFGGINPQKCGWIKVNIINGKVIREEAKKKQHKCGEQKGILTLSYGVVSPEDEEKRLTIAALLKNLTWMMFNLGGVGQGARRPCYSRQNREFAPWFRGSSMFIDADLDNPKSLWYLPESAKDFQGLFSKRLKAFYTALDKLIPNSNIEQKIKTPLAFKQPSTDSWFDAVDKHCKIIVCSGKEQYDKSHALAVLHSDDLKIGGNYDGNLCGQTNKTVKPSPVWIADLDDYQVVTIFGATVAPRSQYLEKLKQKSEQYYQIFPFN
ncbi:hypothetical protein NIES4102_31310 [Chondrocystis sp. NIES-4102]|nr:hypothetical protein NIES4102_31310 [Chondrocystis sp. NIES-4102]